MTPEDEVQLIQMRRVVEGLGWVVISTEKGVTGLQICIRKETQQTPPNTAFELPGP